MDVVGHKLSARAKETRERSEAIESLSTHVRDLWEVLRRRVRRLGQPAEVLNFYQLPLDGVSPNPSSKSEWLALGRLVVQGDAAAVMAGYPAMQNPSAAEVQAVLDVARDEMDDVALADRAYDEAQEGVAALRPQADELAADVMDELRFYLRKREATSQRRIMRTYGANFSYLEGEPHDPDDPA